MNINCAHLSRGNENHSFVGAFGSGMDGGMVDWSIFRTKTGGENRMKFIRRIVVLKFAEISQSAYYADNQLYT